MTFQAPILLLGLLAVPLAVAAYVLAQRRRRRYPVRFPALATLAAVAPATPAWRRHLPAALFGLALASLLVALARPERTVAVPVERASVVLVTDTSRSMEATDVAPSRLEAARAAAGRFLERVPDEVRVGLVAYSDGAQALQAPTTDHGSVGAALDELDPLAGTATGEGLDTALDMLGAGEGDDGPPAAIVLLSDGSATDGDAQFAAAADARRSGIPIYTVALGTFDGRVTLPDGSQMPVPPDPDALRQIASTSRGESFEAEDPDELSAVYERLGSRIGQRDEQREVTAAFAGGALVLLLGAIAGWTRWSGRVP